MGNSTIIDYGEWAIGVILCLVIVSGMILYGKSFAIPYGIPFNTSAVLDPGTGGRMNNLTTDLSGKIENTQTSTQSTNTLGTGLKVWKVFLALPSIMSDGSRNIFKILNINLGGWNLWSVIIAIIIILFVWTLAYYILNQGSGV